MPSTRNAAPYQIDVEFDHLLTLSQAAKLLPEPPSPVTMWRWTSKGVNGGIRLATVKCGSKSLTSKEALNAFINAQTAANQPSPDEPAERSPEQIRQMKAAGLL